MVADTHCNRFGTDGYPILVRKLDKKSTWGDVSDVSGDRIEHIASHVFPAAESQFSLYQVNSDDELKRVVVGLNSYRQRLRDKIDFVAFTHAEITTAGLSIVDSPGNTLCDAANRLHVDIVAPSPGHAAFRRLCAKVVEAHRPTFRISRVKAREMVGELKQYGCHVFEANTDCPCNSG